MRRVFFTMVLLMGLAVFGGAQSETSKPASLFDVVKPDMTVVVYKHQVGADMVEITMQNGDFPKELLSERIQLFGQALGSVPRGVAIERVQIDPKNAKLAFLKASFAVDGMIDVQGGRLRLNPLVQAFTGLSETNQIKGISVVFDGVRATESTVRNYDSPAVRVEGRQNLQPVGVEYRIGLLTTNPKDLTIPDHVSERKGADGPSEPAGSLPLGLYISIAVAGVAAGVLVYSTLLRGGRQRPKNSLGR